MDTFFTPSKLALTAKLVMQVLTPKHAIMVIQVMRPKRRLARHSVTVMTVMTVMKQQRPRIWREPQEGVHPSTAMDDKRKDSTLSIKVMTLKTRLLVTPAMTVMTVSWGT
jgi:hypothetical protein